MKEALTAIIAAQFMLSALARVMICDGNELLLDTTVGDVLTLEPYWHTNCLAAIRISTVWDGGEDGLLSINGIDETSVSTAEEKDFLLTIPVNSTNEYQCVFTTGDVTYRRTLVTTGVRRFTASATGILDTRTGERTVESGRVETIRHSSLWAGDETATATVALKGEAVKSASGEGAYEWTAPSRGGKYTFTHATTKNGAQVGEPLTATFVVPSYDLDIDDGTDGLGGENSRFSYSGVYDGQGHGIAVEVGEEIKNPTIAYALAKGGPYSVNLLITNACVATPVWYTIEVAGYNTYTNWATVTISKRAVTLTSGDASGVYSGVAVTNHTVTIGGDGFVAGEGAVFTVTGRQVAVGSSANGFAYTLKEGTLAQNYDITKVEGTLTVTKAKVGTEDGGEPGEGEVPAGGLSKFDTVVDYDGEGHTIATNELRMAFAEAMIGTSVIGYAAGDAAGGGTPVLPWRTEAPAYTNVGEYVVWYRVTNPNYEDFVHAAKVTIKPSPMVTNLKVTQIAPLGLALDYEVEGSADTATGFALAVKAITADGAVTNVAKTLVGDVGCENGAHRVYWNMAKDGISISRERAVITVGYASSETPEPVSPQGALYCIIDLSNGANATAYAVTYLDKEPTGGFTNEVYKTTKVVLKRVDPGTFIMGSDQTNEAHRVTLTKPFYMGLFEVTQKQWSLVTGSNPTSSYGVGDAYPVYYVSYNMIRGASEGAKWPSAKSVDDDSFLGKLRKRTGLDFDLPTEAQWEYTCRTGTTTKYSYGDSKNDDYMWSSSNSPRMSHEVGTKLANPWGFYDMHGNAWEWCLDWYGTLGYGTEPKGATSGTSRVKRGGAWSWDRSSAEADDFCSSYYRDYRAPSNSSGYRDGFRLSLPMQ